MSRALAVLVLLTMTSTAAQAAEPWRTVDYDGQQYQAQRQDNGHTKLRMTPAQLQVTLGRFEAMAGRLGDAAAGLNLPSHMKRAPGAAIGLLNRMARQMGPHLTFFSPPSFYRDSGSFTFTDGKRFVQVLGYDTTCTMVSNPQIDVKVFRREGGREIVERKVRFALTKKNPDTMRLEREDGRAHVGTLGSPWIAADLQVGNKRWHEYNRLSKKGQWFGRDVKDGKGRFVLRSERSNGKPREVAVKGKTADRLYILSSLSRYRTKLPKWHRHYDAQHMTVDDVSTRLLQKAGVQTVVDGRGKVYLRGSKKLDRSVLRAQGLTYVKRSRDGRRSHLRHLRPRPR